MTTDAGTSSIRSRIRSGRGRPAFAAAGLAILAVAGLAACSSGNSSSAPASSTSVAAGSSTSAAPGRPHNGVGGTIASESPTSWTLTEKDGSTETVTITPQTQFGTKESPATAAQFTVGEMVRVEGQVNGTTVTATRISQGHNRPGGQAPTPSGAAPTGTPAPAN